MRVTDLIALRLKLASACSIAIQLGSVACGGGSTPPDASIVCEYMGRIYDVGAVFPARDGCNSCSCTDVLGELRVQCTLVACCASADTCIDEFDRCGETCCRTGEQCIGGVCQCGTGPACGPGDRCAPLDPNGCGAACCGASAPCE